MRLIGLAIVLGLALLAKPVAAASQPAGQKVPRMATLTVPRHFPLMLASKRFGTVYVHLATSKGKASRLSGALRTARRIVYPALQPNSYVSKWMSLSRAVQALPVPRNKQQLRSQLLWRRIVILLRAGLSPASRVQAGM